MSIYTKRGDGGETGLYDPKRKKGIRISKFSLEISAIGAIDEANSFLGICIAKNKDKKLNETLFSIQADLFLIDSILAGATFEFDKHKTKTLEKMIDDMENILPPLGNFILSGGDELASHIQFARTLVRRAERSLVELNNKEKVSPEILQYINRLSDFLFTQARKINFEKKKPEKIWKVVK